MSTLQRVPTEGCQTTCDKHPAKSSMHTSCHVFCCSKPFLWHSRNISLFWQLATSPSAIAFFGIPELYISLFWQLATYPSAIANFWQSITIKAFTWQCMTFSSFCALLQMSISTHKEVQLARLRPKQNQNSLHVRSHVYNCNIFLLVAMMLPPILNLPI